MAQSGQTGWHPPLVLDSNSHQNDSGESVIVVTPGGNALPVPPGGSIGTSPDGKWIDVKGPDGKSTGDQIHGGHPPTSHPDPRGQRPHAHRPGVTTPDGKPWLPVYPEPGVQPSEWTTGEKAAAAGGAVVGGYLIYRGIRMVPSVVIPPLWPTIPVNIAVP